MSLKLLVLEEGRHRVKIHNFTHLEFDSIFKYENSASHKNRIGMRMCIKITKFINNLPFRILFIDK